MSGSTCEDVEEHRVKEEPYESWNRVINVQQRLPKLVGIVLSQLGPSAQ